MITLCNAMNVVVSFLSSSSSSMPFLIHSGPDGQRNKSYPAGV
jgi:hypothetical protein